MLASSTNLDKCYQLLGLDREASLDRVKSAYRALARRFHPDLNPNDAQAHQRFITLNQAYQLLIDRMPAVPVARPANSPETAPEMTQQESDLKWQLYYELQSLLKQKQFLKAIVLIEGLAQRFDLDTQICQWQGIIYSQFGQELIRKRELNKASIYLKKALKVDPLNRQLMAEVDLALDRITQLSQK